MNHIVKCLKCKRPMKLKNVYTVVDTRTDETIREHTFTCVHCGVTEFMTKE